MLRRFCRFWCFNESHEAWFAALERYKAWSWTSRRGILNHWVSQQRKISFSTFIEKSFLEFCFRILLRTSMLRIAAHQAASRFFALPKEEHRQTSKRSCFACMKPLHSGVEFLFSYSTNFSRWCNTESIANLIVSRLAWQLPMLHFGALLANKLCIVTNQHPLWV